MMLVVILTHLKKIRKSNLRRRKEDQLEGKKKTELESLIKSA